MKQVYMIADAWGHLRGCAFADRRAATECANRLESSAAEVVAVPIIDTDDGAYTELNDFVPEDGEPYVD